jgi:pyruvate dehydrogenase E1 component alpha subunit
MMAQAAETRKPEKPQPKASAGKTSARAAGKTSAKAAGQTSAKAAGKGSAKPADPAIDRDRLLRGYRTMLLIRRFEEKAGQLYGMQLIGGFCHLYIGQEAVVTGMQMAISDGDEVITSYRDHGHMLASGMDARGVMAELTGRAGGYSHGKGGSMHMFSKEKISSAGTASSARRCHSATAWRSPTGIAKMTGCA